MIDYFPVIEGKNGYVNVFMIKASRKGKAILTSTHNICFIESSGKLWFKIGENTHRILTTVYVSHLCRYAKPSSFKAGGYRCE